MCGRYFLERDISDAALLRILETLETREDGKFCGDIFPTDRAPALADGRMLSMRWGFAPPAAGGHQRPQRDGAGKGPVPRRGALPFAGQRLLRMGRRAKTPLRLCPAGRRNLYGRPLAPGGGRGKALRHPHPRSDGGGGAPARAHARAVRRGVAPRLAGRAQSPAGTLARGCGRRFHRRAGTLTQKRGYDTISAVYTNAGGAL